MFYLFDENNKCYSISSYPVTVELPNFVVTSDEIINIERVGLDEHGNIFEIPETATSLPTQEEQILLVSQAVHNHLNNEVRKKDYDSILSCVSYENSTDEQYRADALAVIAWRDRVWGNYYEMVNDVISGIITVPDPKEFVNTLTRLEW